MPSRVVFVTHSAAGAGAELLMLRLLARPIGRPATVVLLEEGELVPMLRAAGVETIVLPVEAEVLAFRRTGGILSAARLVGPVLRASRALARRVRPDDVVVCTSQKAFLLGCLARTGRRFALVWWLHDILTPEHFSPSAIALAVGLSRRLCRRVIANSPETEAAYVAAGGSRAATRVVEPGIDLAAFACAPRRRAAREAGGRPLLVHVSRIAPWKNQMAIVEAMARVDGVDCRIVGACLFGEEDYARALRERIATLGLEDRVTLEGQRPDVAEILAEADIFAHVPLAAEPFGQVVIEAMASGLPVVVARTGAPGRIASDSFAIRVNATDPDAIADAIATLACDPGRRARMGEAARRAAAAYDLAVTRERFMAAIADLGRDGRTAAADGAPPAARRVPTD